MHFGSSPWCFLTFRWCLTGPWDVFEAHCVFWEAVVLYIAGCEGHWKVFKGTCSSSELFFCQVVSGLLRIFPPQLKVVTLRLVDVFSVCKVIIYEHVRNRITHPFEPDYDGHYVWLFVLVCVCVLYDLCFKCVWMCSADVVWTMWPQGGITRPLSIVCVFCASSASQQAVRFQSGFCRFSVRLPHAASELKTKAFKGFKKDLVTWDAEICLIQIRRISSQIMGPQTYMRNTEWAVTVFYTFINAMNLSIFVLLILFISLIIWTFLVD